MDTYFTEMLKLSPHADMGWCSPFSLEELCLFRQKYIKILLVKGTAFYTYLCRFVDIFSKVNKIHVEHAKKFIPLKITSVQAGTKPDEFREGRKLRSVQPVTYGAVNLCFGRGTCLATPKT